MRTVPPTVKLWFAVQPVDFRLGFDGLFALVQSRLNADTLSGHLFVFTNRSANRLKVLYWGGHGLCLWCQRLEAGHYHFPPPADPTAPRVEPTAARFAMILDGIDVSRVRRFKRFTPGDGCAPPGRVSSFGMPGEYDDDPMPTGVPTLHAMIRDPRAELAEVRAKLDAVLAATFGRRSGRTNRPRVPSPDADVMPEDWVNAHLLEDRLRAADSEHQSAGSEDASVRPFLVGLRGLRVSSLVVADHLPGVRQVGHAPPAAGCPAASPPTAPRGGRGGVAGV